MLSIIPLNVRVAVAAATLLIVMSTTASSASDKSKQDAATASAFLINIAYQCQGKLPATAREDARADSVLTLQAGGYSAQEADELIAKMLTAMEGTPPAGTMPAAMCQSFYGKITDQRPALREKLKAEG